MKKISKILCAVLVVAVLCSSLIFMVGAEEAASTTSPLLSGYTASAPIAKSESAKVLEAIKYPAGDNLLTGAGISDLGGGNGLDEIPWSTTGGRGSDLITEPNGNVMHREYLFAPAMDVGNGYAAEGNDYINYTFTKVDITKVEGQNQYIVVDFDFAYEGILDNLSMQVINRGDVGTWAQPQQLKNFGIPANKFVHVTALYNYQDGAAYIFVDGKLAQTVAGGTLKDTQLTNHNTDGKSGNASEFRVGSNSTTTIYLDNLYIRDVKVAEAEDQLAGNDITAWSGNVYGADYTLPTIPYFVSTHTVNPFNENSITNGANYKSGVEGNLLTGIGTGNAGNSTFITLAQGSVDDPYLIAYCNTTTSYKGASNNLFINGNMNFSDPYTVIGEDLKAYYVIDFDIAAPGNLLPGFDVSVVQRRASDTAGFPFSDEIYVGSFYKGDDEWAHVTIVGDIRNNEAKVYVNGTYVGNGGRAVRNELGTSNTANWIKDDTQVKAGGFRIELTRNNIETVMAAGDAVAFDNLSERVYVNGDDALTAALADGDITDWAGYTNGRAGESLPVVATVNGVGYSNIAKLSTACNTNDEITVEFFAKPIVPISFQANATIYTHDMDINALVAFSEDCYDLTEIDGGYTVKAPFVSNESVAKSDKATALSLVKANVEGNIFDTGATTLSEYYKDNGRGRAQYIVTNTATGEQYVRDAVEGASLDTNNTYIDWNVTGGKISYELGVDQFVVFDIDFALHSIGDAYTCVDDEGNLTSMKVSYPINLNPITRNSSAGGVWGNTPGYFGDIYDAAGIGIGEFAHLTAVLSPDTRVMHVFVNGKHVSSIENAIAKMEEGYYFNGFRTFSSSTSAANYDNVAIREIKSSELTAALAAKDITAWSGNVYTDGYELPSVAPIATVDGVVVESTGALSAALTGSSVKEVVILHPFNAPVSVNSNAVINTNGFDTNFVPSEGAVVKTNGNVISIRIPNYVVTNELTVGTANVTIKSGHSYVDAVRYPAEDNLFDKISYNNYNASGYRAAYLMLNTDTGDKYIYDTVFDTDPSTGNTYQNWYFSGPVGTSASSDSDNGYQLGVNQYLLLDFDMAFDAYGATKVNFTTRNSSNTNIAGVSFEIGDAMRNAGIPAGQFAHITLLAEVDTNTVYVYVNGNKALTVANGICNSSYAPVDDTYWLDGIRLLQNLSTPVKFDNLYARVTEDASLKGLDTLVGTSYNVYTDSYKLPVLPRLASVDGVDYYSSEELNAALNGNVDTPKNVVFYHPNEATINVNCDAVINTNGFAVDLNYYKVGTLTDNGDDTYTFDCGYISATAEKNVTSTGEFTDAVNVKGNDNIITSIHYDTTGTFMNTSWLDKDGNKVEGIHTYLVSSEGMDNLYGLLARPEGSTGDIGLDQYKIVDGELVKDPTVTGTYINLQFNTTNNAHYFTYSASENNYWVYDFDMLVEGDALNIYGYNLIKTAAGGFQYGGYSYNTAFANRVVEYGNVGKFNHFTIVADYNNNLQYVFLNDNFIGTAPLMGDGQNSDAPATAYVEGAQYYNLGLRISLAAGNPTDKQSYAIDNTLVRKFVTSDSDNLAEAMEAEDITLWTGRYEYTLPETPLLGTVNGVEYNNVGDLNEAVKASDGEAEVEILRAIRGDLQIGGKATVNTNYFVDVVAEKLDTYYEFESADYGKILATGKFVAIKDGVNYTVTEINADNYTDYATLVLFYTEIDEYKEAYYAFIYGDQIVVPDWVYEDQYDSEAGTLKQAKWFDSEGNLVEELPVASADLGEPYFELKWADKSLETEMDVKVSVTVDTSFSVNIYVPADLLMEGTYSATEEIDGVVYAVYTKSLTANKLGEVLVFELFAKGNDYPEFKTVTVAKYAEELFAGEYDVLDKNLMAAALVYANEAYKLLGGNADFASLIEANAEYVLADAELTEKLPTDVFGGLIRSAAMYLDETPKFAFKIAMGFDGMVEFHYSGWTNNEEMTYMVGVPVNTVDGEQLVVLDNLKVYNVHNDITIKFITDDGEICSGVYNLATYAQSLSDNAFAVALYNLANIAEDYVNPTVEEPTPEEPTPEEPTPEEPTTELAGHEYTEIDKTAVSADSNLLLINEGKIKQMDQATLDDGSNSNANGYFTKEGGTAKFVLIDKDGAQVEALYFSRSEEYDWDTYGDDAQNNGFVEHRYNLDSSKKIASISFDYIIDGTCSGAHGTYGEGYVEIKTAAGDYVSVIQGAEAFLEDGEWHTATWTPTEDTYLSNVLVKLYHFNGEFAIANLVITYAE